MTSAVAPDPRVNAYRADLADVRLKGRVAAPRYVEGVPRRVAAASAPMRRAPSHHAALDTEALFGECVRVFEETDAGWAWSQLDTDGYVGWMPACALGAAGPPPTHRVAALRTFIYPAPDIKRPPVMALSLGARVFVRCTEGIFAQTDDGWLVARHVAALDSPESDPVAVALRFLGTPYLWGGRTSLGLDCSALVQLALDAAGIACPRDSDMQARDLGGETALRDPGGLQRGDLVFWPGHVALAAGDGGVVHASGHHMEVVAEPAGDAFARIASTGQEVSSVRRIPR